MGWPKTRGTENEAAAFARSKATGASASVAMADDSAPTTETLLADSRAALAAASAAIEQATADRNEKLLAGAGAPDVAEVDASLEQSRRVVSTETDRIKLLEQRLADEQHQRRVAVHEQRITAISTLLEQRVALAADLAGHLQATAAAFRKINSLNAQINNSWRWHPGDVVAMEFGNHFVHAVGFELFRISAPAGAPDHAQFTLPGAECPTPASDRNPASVRPLVDRMRDATAFGIRALREAPLPAPRPIEIEAPKHPAPPVAVPMPPAASAASASAANTTEIEPSEPVFSFIVDFVHLKTRETLTKVVELGPDEMQEAGADPLGPSGPAGRAIALRVATSRVPAGYVLSPAENSVRLDVRKLMESMAA